MSVLDVFVVTYRSEAYLPRLLKELKATMRTGADVRVADNTGNPIALTALWNDLWRSSSAEHVAILNPDIRPSNAWDEKLLAAIQNRPTVAAAIPNRYIKLKPEAPVENINDVAAELETRPYNKPLGTHLEGFYVFMARRAALEALQGFDERFRFYFADSDFQLRALAAGMKTVQVNHCPVLHAGRVSTRDAESNGELDRKEELKHAEAVRQALEAGELRPWHELSGEDRRAVRLDPRYNRLSHFGR